MSEVSYNCANTFHHSTLPRLRSHFPALPTFSCPQSLWRRCRPQQPHQHLHPLHPLSHSTSGPQVSALSAAVRITPADGTTSHSRQSDQKVRIRTPWEV